MSLTSKRKKVKIFVHGLDAYSCVIKNLKQKQVKQKTALSSAQTKFVWSSTSPVGTLVKHHSSQRNVALPTPLVRKFVCHAEGFRLFQQTSAWSGQVSPGTKGLLFER